MPNRGPGQLGKMLPHEHILVDFVGADEVRPDRYDADEEVQQLTATNPAKAFAIGIRSA